ncbi:MAG TPA: hypothetical protein VFF69_09395 [Phycisphaerales bacterium]|nr:hypothetical protein [Phycisphaerales bacterium]
MLLSAAAGAQETEPPAESRPDARTNPVLTDPSLDQDVSERASRPEAAGALLPTRAPGAAQVVPQQGLDPTRLALAGGDQWASAATLLPEGTFLVRRVGEVVRLRTGGLAFVPAAQEGSPSDPAMPLLPCEVYGRLAALLDGAEGRLWMAITGEVFEYHDRNYLLPNAFASIGAGPEVQTPSAGEPEPPPAVEPEAEPAEAGADPRIEQLVRELEAERAERRGLDTDFGSVPPPAAEGTPAGARIEGKLLLGRRARMVRGSAGSWAIVLDNDADQAALDQGLPERLHLLPGTLVREMERQAERRGESWTFEVSGNLYRYGERVYLVPRMFVSLPADEVAPLQ